MADWDMYEFMIAGCYLSALINGDESGLTDEEIEELDFFIAGYSGGHWSVDSEEPEFCQDEVSGLMADCYAVTYNFQVKQGE